jgi:hypothetical protein
VAAQKPHHRTSARNLVRNMSFSLSACSIAYEQKLWRQLPASAIPNFYGWVFLQIKNLELIKVIAVAQY